MGYAVGKRLTAVRYHSFRWNMDDAQIAPETPNRGDGIDEAALASVMSDVPRGAAVLAGAAVALLVIGWLLIYLLVFIPRGVVG